MVHFRGRLNLSHIGHLAKECRHFEIGRTQRHSLQVVDGLHLIFRVLHGDEIIVAIFGVNPVAGRDHDVRSERGDYVVHDFFGAEAELAGALAIDGQLQRRIIHVLRDINVRYARYLLDLARQILGDGVAGFQIHPAYLNINRRGHTLV